MPRSCSATGAARSCDDLHVFKDGVPVFVCCMFLRAAVVSCRHEAFSGVDGGPVMWCGQRGASHVVWAKGCGLHWHQLAAGFGNRWDS
jgi:hypothetical protein